MRVSRREVEDSVERRDVWRHGECMNGGKCEELGASGGNDETTA